ncbi:MAG TPA: hypothetical protein VFA33_28280 [Bryobacteraceae bacterium]|nr:hypothetical protein [Bryobacteraceae bacterium]
MDLVLWFLAPGLLAVGSGVLTYFIMQSRMEVALAREREATAEARGALEAERKAMAAALANAEESGRRGALDDFLADLRVEQRHYTREQKLLFLHRRSLVLQERIFFRNIPLSNWIEHEVVLEDGADVEKLTRSLTVFDNPALALDPPPPRRLLR